MTFLFVVLTFFKMDKNPKADNINYTMEVGKMIFDLEIACERIRRKVRKR